MPPLRPPLVLIDYVSSIHPERSVEARKRMYKVRQQLQAICIKHPVKIIINKSSYDEEGRWIGSRR